MKQERELKRNDMKQENKILQAYKLEGNGVSLVDFTKGWQACEKQRTDWDPRTKMQMEANGDNPEDFPYGYLSEATDGGGNN